VDTGVELDEEGQQVKCASVLFQEDAELKSAVALQVEQLQLSEGSVHSPSLLQ
jgi:hypothetical protein